MKAALLKIVCVVYKFGVNGQTWSLGFRQIGLIMRIKGLGSSTAGTLSVLSNFFKRQRILTFQNKILTQWNPSTQNWLISYWCAKNTHKNTIQTCLSESYASIIKMLLSVIYFMPSVRTLKKWSHKHKTYLIALSILTQTKLEGCSQNTFLRLKDNN